MKIIVPMAGRGSRFSNNGWAIPKPMIPVFDKPMYSWALAGLPVEFASQIVFICLKEHLSKLDMEADIMSRFGSYAPTIIPVSEVTTGQLSTVLLAREVICVDEAILIHNADTYFRSNLVETIQNNPTAEGILTLFEAEGERWSFAKIENEKITEVREKKRISKWGSVGAYYFASGRRFVDIADRFILENKLEKGEYYIAPLYNEILDAGGLVVPDYAYEVGCMGTPEDLKEFTEKFSSPTLYPHLP